MQSIKKGDEVVVIQGKDRGKRGVVVRETPAYPFPDAHAHGVVAHDEPTYDVAFRTQDLWPNDSDPATVHVGVFQSYLTQAEAVERRSQTSPSPVQAP